MSETELDKDLIISFEILNLKITLFYVVPYFQEFKKYNILKSSHIIETIKIIFFSKFLFLFLKR